MTDHDLRPPGQRRAPPSSSGPSPTQWLLVILGIAAAGYGGWWAREHWAARERAALTTPAAVQTPAAVLQAVPSPAPEPAAPEVAESAAQPEADAGPQHPLTVAQQDSLDAEDSTGFDQAIRQWLGERAVQFVALPGLAHHIVATVDNLPRSHAAPRLWPIYPVGGQMPLTTQEDGSLHIAPANSARYDAVIGFVTGLDVDEVARHYRRAYPVLQQAYENVGYPGRYFNDRVVTVIDHLLKTPDVQAPMAVRLVQVQGQVPSQQPWLRYEWADSNLQELSAGQKILLRIGPAHRQQLMAWMLQLRSKIAP